MGEVALKAMLVEDIIRDMQRIEYEMNKLMDFDGFTYENYYSMWEAMKLNLQMILDGKI